MPNSLVSASGMGNGATQAAPDSPDNALVPQNQTNQAAAPMAAGAPQGAQATTPQQKQVQLSEAKEALVKQATIDRALRGLLEGNEGVPRKKVIDMAVDLVAERVMTAQGMAGYLADLPDDPLQIRKWAMMHAQTVEKGLDQLVAMLHGVDQPPAAAQPGMAAPPGAAMQ